MFIDKLDRRVRTRYSRIKIYPVRRVDKASMDDTIETPRTLDSDQLLRGGVFRLVKSLFSLVLVLMVKRSVASRKTRPPSLNI